jgi:uncharacterized secreted protein with C-terminal beta-propeller domain
MRRFLAVAVVVVATLGSLAPGAGAAKRAHLSAFPSCAALVDYGRHELARTGGGAGVPVRVLPVAESFTPGQVKAAPPAPTAGVEDKSGAGDPYSGTNNQEAGVDESDVVKTDGKRMFVLAGTKVLAIDVTGSVPKLVGTLTLESTGQELLLRGDRLLVIGRPNDFPIVEEPVPGAPVVDRGFAPSPSEVELTEIDVHDPAAMKQARTLTVDGSYVSARLNGGTARVVLNTSPRIPTETAKSGLRAFVPQTVIRSRISGRTFKRSLVPCDDVRRPITFSGLDLLTVLTIDLDRGLYSVDRDAVMAGAQAVYASTKGLYVVSQRFVRELDTPDDIPSRMTTEVHRFDISDPDRTTYAASGSVPGFVLNQYSLSEDKGVLRVASTEEPLWLGGDVPARDSESTVSVLRQQGDRLVTVGSVGGLGKTERIYAARFIGDAGYLVTFRQIDPLYTLDLSDPEHPKVAGELKIAGYSAYLHPVGDGLLLGVGQDATEAGRRAGAQVSLFDVSDPAHPSRLAKRSLGDVSSGTAVEFDPHAFLWWPKTDTAVIPVQDKTGSAAVGLRVRKAGIDEIGRATHPGDAYAGYIRRALVVGDRLFTLSDLGVGSNALSSFAPLGFLAFPTG